MKIYRKTIILFIIGVLLFCWYYFYEVRGAKKREEIKLLQKRIFPFEKDEVSFLGIYREDFEVECLKKKNKWIIEKPERFDGDKEEIERIIDKLVSLEIERNIGKVENLKDFGLEKPEKKIVLGKDGERLILYIGGENPSKTQYYVTKDKENVYLVSLWELKDIINKDLFSLRDKTILPVDKEKVREIAIKNGPLYIKCVKENEKWMVVKPVKDIGDKDRIEEIIEKIKDEKIKRFIDKEKEISFYGLKFPKIAIIIKQNGEAYSLFIGKRKGGRYYAKNSLKKCIFEIDKSVVDILPKRSKEIREKSVFQFDIPDVEEFSIMRKEESLSIKKEKGKWKILEFPETEPDADKVEDFLWDLTLLEIKDFIKPEKSLMERIGLSPPEIRIKVKVRGKFQQIYFGKEKNGIFYGYSPERNIIFTLPSSDYKKIDKKIKDFLPEGE